MTREEIASHLSTYLHEGNTIKVLPQYIPSDTQKHTIYSHSKRSRGGGMSYTRPHGYKTSSVYNGWDHFKTNEVIKHISKLKIREVA